MRFGELLCRDLLAQYASVDILGRISRDSQRLSGITEIVVGACLERLPGGEGDFHVDSLTAKAGWEESPPFLPLDQARVSLHKQLDAPKRSRLVYCA